MRRVANRKTVRFLALRMVRANKKKNLAVIFAVILTTVLFTTLFSVYMSMSESVRNATMRQSGARDMAELKYGREEDYEKLKADHAVKDISYRILVGVLSDQRLKDQGVEVYYATDENADVLFSYPTSGAMPQKQNEIVLSTLTMEKLGVEAAVGQPVRLTLLIGRELVEADFILSGFYEGNSVAMAQMAYVSRDFQEQYAPEPEVSYQDSDKNDLTGYWSIGFDFRSSFNIEGQVKKLLLRNGYDLQNCEYGVNWAYENAYVDPIALLGVGALAFIILLAGYLIIYNIFYISVVSDIHSMGLLKTIGASGRQLKKMVMIQARILCLAGIPAGLLAGTAVARVLFPVILKETTVGMQNMEFSVHPLIYIFAALFSMLTVWVGCKKPGKIAGRVSPVEGVRYEPQTSVKKKKKHTKKVSVLQLAMQNFGRERKKAAVVVLSLTLSLFLVNSVCILVTGMDPDKYVSASIIGDINVSHVSRKNLFSRFNENSVVSEDALDFFHKIDGVADTAEVYCDLPHYASVRMGASQKELLAGLAENDVEDENDREFLKDALEAEYACEYYFYGIDDKALDYMEVQEGGIDREKWRTGNYAICYSWQYIVPSGDDDRSFPLFHAGDEISVKLYNGKQCTYEVMAVAELPPALSAQRYSSVGGQVIVPSSRFLEVSETKGALVSVLDAEPGKLEAVEDVVASYVNRSDELAYDSKKTYLKEFDDMLNEHRIVGFGLAFFLAVIGIMNFANAVVTGISSRARELAIMQAVGLTGRQMRGMLVCEGMFYGVVTAAVTAGLYACFGKWVIHLYASDMWYFEYHFTVMPILVCLPFILLISAAVPLAACSKMEERGLTERMRME